MSDDPNDTTVGFRVLKLLPPPPPEPATPEPPKEPLADVVSIAITTESVRGEWCRHHSQLYCEEQRTIQCKDCGAMLDPFAAYLLIAQQYGRLATSVSYKKGEEKELEARIEELKRVERNTKARIRKADPTINLRDWRGPEHAAMAAEHDRISKELGRPTYSDMLAALQKSVAAQKGKR